MSPSTSAASSPHPPSSGRSALLALTPDLRRQIYTHVEELRVKDHVQVVPRDEPWCPPICQVCRLVRHETITLFLAQNTFVVEERWPDEESRETIRETTKWLESLGPCISALDHLVIRQDFSEKCSRWPDLYGESAKSHKQDCILGFSIALNMGRAWETDAQGRVSILEEPSGHACAFTKESLPCLRSMLLKLFSNCLIDTHGSKVLVDHSAGVVEDHNSADGVFPNFYRLIPGAIRMAGMVADAHDEMCEDMREHEWGRGELYDFFSAEEKVARMERITRNSLKELARKLRVTVV